MKIDASDIMSHLGVDLRLTLEDIEKDVNTTADIILTSVKADTPVETGTAQRGWNKTKEGGETVVENNVPYIGFLDEGTANHAGNHMVDKAIQKAGK